MTLRDLMTQLHEPVNLNSPVIVRWVYRQGEAFIPIDFEVTEVTEDAGSIVLISEVSLK